MQCETVLTFSIDRSYSMYVKPGYIQVIAINNVSGKMYAIELSEEAYSVLKKHLETLEINPLAFMFDAVKLQNDSKDKDSK